jgi:hypothetical protein
MRECNPTSSLWQTSCSAPQMRSFSTLISLDMKMEFLSRRRKIGKSLNLVEGVGKSEHHYRLPFDDP